MYIPVHKQVNKNLGKPVQLLKNWKAFKNY